MGNSKAVWKVNPRIEEAFPSIFEDFSPLKLGNDEEPCLSETPKGLVPTVRFAQEIRGASL